MIPTIIDLWQIIKLSFSNPLEEQSFHRTSDNYRDALIPQSFQAFNLSKKDSQYVDEHIDFLKKQVENLNEELRERRKINLSVAYKCILVFCGALVIIAITILLIASFMFDDPPSYSQKRLVDICMFLLVNMLGAFAGLVGGKAIN
jgi:hypothetical protein